MVAKVDRGFLPGVFWARAIAGESPVTDSHTAGLASRMLRQPTGRCAVAGAAQSRQKRTIDLVAEVTTAECTAARP